MVNYSFRLRILTAVFGSQTKLANSLGVSKSYISKLLRGVSKPENMSAGLRQKVNRRWFHYADRGSIQLRVKGRGIDGEEYYTTEMLDIKSSEELFNEQIEELMREYQVINLSSVQARFNVFDPEGRKRFLGDYVNFTREK